MSDGPGLVSDPDGARVELDEFLHGATLDLESVRVTNALGALARLVVTDSIPTVDLAALADDLEAQIARHPVTRSTRYRPEHDRDADGGAGFRPNGSATHPFVGRRNPYAVPITLSSDGTEIRGQVTFDERHEGIPGLAQGGVIAGCFDVLLARAAALTRQGGPTGTYSVRFVAPTPINEPLEFSARPTEIEGRKLHVAAELRRGDGAVVATAVGIMIRTEIDRMRA